ncbi:hypothetical protein CDCA_CDCA09G2619 [Cyanidium caldarium]|uniref:Uncharacterized protein n=1 Tax=Cyanidium caldarium TaxID=2771 RepID=A0AAV9IWE6_CYACA|nr:hypothetical protein CDCA_CDCA09G2619 [Cyanidium caldarium]
MHRGSPSETLTESEENQWDSLLFPEEELRQTVLTGLIEYHRWCASGHHRTTAPPDADPLRDDTTSPSPLSTFCHKVMAMERAVNEAAAAHMQWLRRPFEDTQLPDTFPQRVQAWRRLKLAARHCDQVPPELATAVWRLVSYTLRAAGESPHAIHAVAAVDADAAAPAEELQHPLHPVRHMRRAGRLLERLQHSVSVVSVEVPGGIGPVRRYRSRRQCPSALFQAARATLQRALLLLDDRSRTPRLRRPRPEDAADEDDDAEAVSWRARYQQWNAREKQMRREAQRALTLLHTMAGGQPAEMVAANAIPPGASTVDTSYHWIDYVE